MKMTVVDETIVRNPADDLSIEKPRVFTEKKAQVWTPTDVQTFLDVCYYTSVN